MEKKISSELIYDGKIITVYKDKVECENGNLATREVVRHHGGVGVLAIVDDKILLVKQYRYPNAVDTLEIPAGKLELNEDTAICALRELEEETGYRAKSLSHLTSMYLSPGFANEVLHIYHAQGVEKVENPLAQDEDEVLELYHLTLEEAQQAMKDQLICDAKTIYAIQYWELLTKGK